MNKMEAQFEADRRLCPLSMYECHAARDREIFNRVCLNNFPFCFNFREGKPISKEEYESKGCVVELIKEDETIALSGGK